MRDRFPVDVDQTFFHRPKTYMQTSIKKRLWLKLTVASVLISIALASVVFFIELNRVGRLVNGRAAEIARHFNEQIRYLLDSPAWASQASLQYELRTLLIAGKHKSWFGHLVYAGIFDSSGRQVVSDHDTGYALAAAVTAFMESRSHHMPEISERLYQFHRIEGATHIRLAFGLTNSSAERVGFIEGLFAVSPEATDEVLGRIARSVFSAIGTVALTTLILYPIILSLFRRLSLLADGLLAANIETLRVLGSAIAKRDSDTHIHNYRVTIYSVTLAEALNLENPHIRELIKGAFLHDVGKIGISDQILMKPGKLTDNEFEIMKGHVKHGIDIVGRSEWLKDAMAVVGYHHERYDGTGYPHGFRGSAIPITARIFAVADVFDALTSTRPYKAPIAFEAAMQILSEGRGNHFDPFVFDVFNNIARSLYEEVANASDENLSQTLESITRQYFSEELYP